MALHIKSSTSTYQNVRKIVRGAAAAIIVAGIVFHAGTGTLSSMGWDYISTLCPLGALEALFGSFAFVPRLVIVLVVMVALVLLVGSAFCSWACPVPVLKRFFSTKRMRAAAQDEQKKAAEYALEQFKGSELRSSEVKRAESEGSESEGSKLKGSEPCAKTPAVKLDSRHLVLGGALLTTAVFGFPVFCVVCPVGLTFAIVVMVVRLFEFGELTWGVLIFPLLLVAEMTLLRSWCSKICPIGALFSLISSASKTLRPRVDANLCARSKDNAECKACSQACPQLIDPHSDLGIRPQSECTHCGRCSQACPFGAISFPLK